VLLRDWSQAIVKMYEPDPSDTDRAAARSAAGEFAGYVQALAADRARRPADDLLSALVAARDGSDRLSSTELVATVVLLLNAGHEASVNGFGNGLASWLEVEQQRVGINLDDEARLASLVEEMLRFDSPLQLFERTATEDLQIAGVTVRRGQKIAAPLLGAANRDPAVFTDPDVLDPFRPDNRHIAFGAGIHFCLGAPLARLELQISIRSLLRRFGRLRLMASSRRDTFVLRGFRSLVVAPVGDAGSCRIGRPGSCRIVEWF
jgi:cytochrome P450